MARPRAVEDELLLTKAVELFWRNGYARTGVRELEEKLGLKAPSLYNRFGSKDALFQAALAHYLERVVRTRIARYLRAGEPLQGLRAFFDSCYDYAPAGESALGCLLVNSALELQAGDAETRAQLTHGSRMIRAAFRVALRRAQRAGQLRHDADSAALAEALHVGLQGLLVSARSERDKAVLRRKTDALFALLPTLDRRLSKKGATP
jgi:TetR/AcrR family transcriptional repressor of nem operon